ncbi:MAG TPA: hypothetical protein VHR43_09170 [Gemmatimonadales bacterium]|jgi:hypothetical protein|nr:hypothetical protein [Gemmatimonadales bacterium]
MRTPLAAALVVLLLTTSSAAAQDSRLAGRLDSTTRAGVATLLDRARANRLPAEPLVQKALEGASKGAPGPRIVSAVEAVLADLQRAQATLGPGAAPGDLVAASAALRAGATPSMLAEIRRAQPRGGIAVPLGVFTDLVAGGLSVSAAWRSVADLARDGGDEQQFLDLRDRLRPPAPPGPP